MIVINFYGAPSSGKTGTAGELFGKLKRLGFEVDYLGELVRHAHYTKNVTLLGDELYLLAEKNHRLLAMKNAGIQVAVTDGPILNSLVYKPDNYFPSFDDVVKEAYHSYQNFNIMIPGVRNFSEIGRGEKDVMESKEREKMISAMLSTYPHETIDPDAEMPFVDQAYTMFNQYINHHQRKVSFS